MAKPAALFWEHFSPPLLQAPGVFHTCFYNHARRLRLEKLSYVELSVEGAVLGAVLVRDVALNYRLLK